MQANSDTAVAESLSRDLQPYAKDPADQNREKHLLSLCKTARGVSRMTQAHPSNWSFGPWDGSATQFPSVLKDGKEVVAAEQDL